MRTATKPLRCSARSQRVSGAGGTGVAHRAHLQSTRCSHVQSIPPGAQEPTDTHRQGMTEPVWGHNIYPAPE